MDELQTLHNKILYIWSEQDSKEIITIDLINEYKGGSNNFPEGRKLQNMTIFKIFR